MVKLDVVMMNNMNFQYAAATTMRGKMRGKTMEMERCLWTTAMFIDA
tara:strand:- start:5975 stop:6115 length:141 start_codon:yes stop_codon:yes gene_type:complete